LSISTVIFPTMARQFETGKLDDLARTFSRALAPLLFLTIPASVGLFELRTALPQAVFQLGAFDQRSTALVSPALAFLAAGLVWYALVEVLARVFYAMRDTRTPVVAGVAIVAINIALGVVLVDRIDHRGLAIALSASTGIEALILFAVLRQRIGRFDDEFGGWLGRVVIAAAAMACIAEIIRPKLEAATRAEASSKVTSVLLLGFATALLGFTYLVVAWYLKLPEAMRFVGLVETRTPDRIRRYISRP
jgi:putative peptidoglycan lipid II flippase